MIPNLTKDTLIGNFEAWEEQEAKISNLEGQKKIIKSGLDDTIDQFVKEIEAPKADVKAAYARWKKLKKSGDGVSESLYTLFSMVDDALENEDDEA